MFIRDDFCFDSSVVASFPLGAAEDVGAAAASGGEVVGVVPETCQLCLQLSIGLQTTDAAKRSISYLL